MGERRARALATLVLLAAHATAIAVTVDLEHLVSQAITARAAGDYPTAVAALERVIAAAPERVDYQVLLAETLGWSKRFDEAEALYRRVLEAGPQRRDARLGLARVLLWSGRYRDARLEAEKVVAADRRDAEALEVRAMAAYWSGDLRRALRELRQVLFIDPHRQTVEQTLSDIERASSPDYEIAAELTDDDQPYRLLESRAMVRAFSDPLTRWSAAIGTYRGADRSSRREMPFGTVGAQVIWPEAALTVTSAIGGIRYPDGVTRPTAMMGASRRVTSQSSVALRAERHELLSTATALASHPSSITYALTWRRDPSDRSRWSAAAETAALSYFDGNSGVSSYAWLLVPIRRAGWGLEVGASAAFRDTATTRFQLESVTATEADGSFRYSYRGVYSPYWTPRHLREARVIAVASAEFGRVRLGLHVEGGLGQDRGTAFLPDAGLTSLPSTIDAFEFRRRYHPYRAEVKASTRLPGTMRLDVSLGMNSTVFYRAKTFDVTLVRHH